MRNATLKRLKVCGAATVFEPMCFCGRRYYHVRFRRQADMRYVV